MYAAGAAKADPAAPTRVRIVLVGPMQATGPDNEDLLPRARGARAILAALCLARGGAVPRARLTAEIWDSSSEKQAKANFRQALFKLTKAFGRHADLIVADRDGISLDVSQCWVDALAFRQDVSAIPEADLARVSEGRVLDELNGISVAYDQWLIGERTRFTDELRQRHEAELQRLSASHAPPEDIAASARRLIVLDPTHEAACRATMLALTQMGLRAKALQVFQRCREALETLLGAVPSSQTVAVYEAIRAEGARGGHRRLRGASVRPALGPSLTRRGPRRIRTGVMPFTSTFADLEETVAATLAQELAGALSRLRWFDVFALESNEWAAAAQNPEVDYVLGGALSLSDGQVRVSVQLLSVEEGLRPLWGEHFEAKRIEPTEFQAQVVARIVGRLGPILVFVEGRRAAENDEADGTALWLRAIPLMYSLEREKYEQAGALLERALGADPNNAMVAAWSAYWQVYHVGQGWTDDAQRAFETADAMCVRAMRLDPENAEAMGIYGHICAFLHRDFDSALHHFDRSLRLDPNSAFIWALSAASYCYVGAPGPAIERMDRYRDLAPFDPYFPWFETVYTIAHCISGDYARAAIVGRRVVAANPSFGNAYKHLLPALGHLGRRDEAARYVEKLLRIEPDFTVSRFVETYPLRRRDDRVRFAKGMQLAGVPN